MKLFRRVLGIYGFIGLLVLGYSFSAHFSMTQRTHVYDALMISLCLIGIVLASIVYRYERKKKQYALTLIFFISIILVIISNYLYHNL